jgi:hypothetical protein
MKKIFIFTVATGILLSLSAFYLLKKESNIVVDPEDYSWMVGHWKGDGFGGISEEVWAPAVDGTMMGMYRHYKDGNLVFYEFMLIDETGLKLKHFNPDLTGWEEKDDFLTFSKVGYSKDKLEFKGLTFERKNDQEMEIRLKMKRQGEISTEVFSMKRVQ